MHSIPLSCTSSPCNLLFLNPGVYGLVQATVGVGTVLIWDFCVAYTNGGGTPRPLQPPLETVRSLFSQARSIAVVCLLFSCSEVLCRSLGSPVTFVLHESRWQCINATVASLVFWLPASVQGTTICLEIPLRSAPPRRPSLGDRPPPPWETVAPYGGGIAKGGGSCPEEVRKGKLGHNGMWDPRSWYPPPHPPCTPNPVEPRTPMRPAEVGSRDEHQFARHSTDAPHVGMMDRRR